MNGDVPDHEYLPMRHFPPEVRQQQMLDLVRGRARPLLRRDEKRHARYERMEKSGIKLRYLPGENKVACYVAGVQLTKENNYFEIEILDGGQFTAIAIGLVPYRYMLDQQPGWNLSSVAYHADDGKLFKGSGRGKNFGPVCHEGDRMGCGVKYEPNASRTVTVFFTKNGKEVGSTQTVPPPDGLHPAVGMHSEGEEVLLRLDAEWEFVDPVLMAVDTCEDDWTRLHDVKLNGMALEYIGRGKSITDVGLAQAKSPLNTTNHYYELEICDPGENCYIAIGLARRNYPRHRHPGWNKGSIAYHADDGKVFVGSGVGEVFGPRCFRGDIMGCGILFPRDYVSDDDYDDSSGSPNDDVDCPQRFPSLSRDDIYLDVDEYPSSASDDDDDDAYDFNWDLPHYETGTTVQVFFTRNGKTIGRRSINIPKGGFYPTIGMMSCDEKVRVDLRPLTG